MRLLTLLSIIFLSLGCNTSKKSNANRLNGNWIPVKQEIGGVSLPNSVFKNQKLIVNDSTYTMMAESVDKGIIKLSGNRMDIYGRVGVNAGKHFTAIRKIKDGQMTVCYNLAGDSYPDSFDTKGKPMYFLSVFEKELGK
jgi:uncharacterized protein (TIGR03067 family)